MSHRLLLTLILLVAAGLRLYGLAAVSPPGLSHDEVAHWLINRDIAAGHHAVYFTEAYGHEAGFHYLQVIFMLLLGDNALALRLPSAFAGLLLVPVTFALSRRLFGRQVALTAAAFAAVLFWPVFYSRQAIRAISLPLMSGLSAYFWWRAWETERGKVLFLSLSHFHFLLAALFAGLSLHMYMAGRVVPIFYALFLVYLALFHRPQLRRRGPGVLLFVTVFGLVAAPLLYYLVTNPGAEVRIGEVDAPLRALRDGDWRPAATNSLRIAGMFGFAGDPLWRQNIAGLPVFDPVTAVLFYIGVLLSARHWRQKRHLFALLWLFTGFIPSIITIDAPSSIRISNILPVLAIFPARVIHSFRPFSTAFQQLSPDLAPTATKRLAGILILLHIVWTTVAIFWLWPAHNEVRFVWQKALAEAAVFLDRSSSGAPVAVAGWTPDTMDPPTMALLLRRQDLDLRYFDPRQTLLLPAVADGQIGRIIRPTVLPLQSDLEAFLRRRGAAGLEQGSFTLYIISYPLLLQPAFPAGLRFADQLTFLGHDQLSSCLPGEQSLCRLVSYWRVEAVASGPRRLFLHLVDEQGENAGQDDGLAAPSAYWQPGDTILHYHELAIPDGGPFALRLGVYNPDTGERLRVHDEGEYILLWRQGGLP
jgi:4-amino-4-deoxy-L-arabinose transferase-like glycosyltransferase